MRIISGYHKGRKIQVPKNLSVRPTTDRSKEGLFNILQNSIDFKRIKVIDLFSGTGSISYEFASRGSKNISALDINKQCVKFIQKTSDTLDMKITVNQLECFRFLEKNSMSFDLIFADPPYKFDIGNYRKIISLCEKRLTKKGFLVIEHFKKINLSEIEGFSYKRVYGNNVFSFFIFKNKKAGR